MARHKITIDLALTDDELHILASGAFAAGFIRKDEAKAWDTAEYIEAAKVVAAYVVDEFIESRS